MLVTELEGQMNNDSEEFKKRKHHLSEVTEEIYQAIFSSIDEGFCIIEIIFDDKGNPLDYLFLETNAVFEDMTGLKNPNGKTALELVPDLEKKWIEIYGNVAITGNPIRFTENSVPMGRWFDVYAMKVGGNESNLVALLFRDITKIKRHDENLAFIADIQADLANLNLADEIMQSVSQKLFAYLNISHCVFAKIDQANNRAVVQFDWHQKPTASLKGDYRLSDFVSSEFRQQNQAGNTIAINNTQADPRTDAVEFAALDIYSFITVPFHKLGEWKYLFMVYDSAARIWEKDEIELIQEITSRIFPRLERAWAEESLRESEKQLRAFSKNLPGGAAFIVNQDLQYLLADGEALKIANFTPEDFLGKTIFEVLPPELVAEYLPIYQKALNGEYLTYEHSAHGRNYLTRCVPLYDSKGAVNAALAMSYDITERKETEDKLRETTAVLSAINENTPTLIYFKDRESRILSANPATIAVIGKPLEEVIGKTPPEYLDDNVEGAKIRENDQRIITNGKTETLEEIVKTKDGERIFLSTKSPYFDENNEIIGLVGVSIDITERKKAEADLQASEERYKALAEASAQVVWTMDDEGNSEEFQYWFSQTTGLSNKEIDEKEYLNFVYPDDREKLQNTFFGKAKDITPYQIEFRLLTKENNYRYYNLRGVPLLSRDGSLREWVGTVTDINEKKEADKYLQRYRLLSEKADDVIWMIQPNGDIIEINQAAINTYGYSREELLQMNLRDLRAPDTLPSLNDDLNKALQNGIKFETQHICKDRTIIDVEVNASSAVFAGEKLILGIVRNITERKRLEEQVQRQFEELKTIYRTAPIGLALVDKEFRFLQVNTHLAETNGIKLEDHIGKTIYEVIPDIAEQVEKIYKRIFASGEAELNIEIKGETKAQPGIVRCWNNSCYPLKDEHGNVIAINVIIEEITDRKRVEEKLLDSEYQLRLALDSAKMGIHIWNISENTLYWDERVRELWGIEPTAEINYETFISGVHPDDVENIQKSVEYALNIKNRSDFSSEYRIINKKDKKIRWVSATGKIFFDGDKPKRLIGTVQDISKRKEAEAALQAKDELLSRLTNVTPTLLAHCSKDYRYLFVNQSLGDFLGLKTEEIIGESVPKIMGEDAFNLILPYVKKVLSGERVEFESEIPYSTAGKHYMHVVYVPEFDKQNNVIGWFATITDITDRKEAERVNSFLASIIESSNDAIISKDLNGTIISWNQSAEKMFGYKKDEIIGKSVATLIPNEFQFEEALILQKLQSGIGIQHYETKRQRKDGTQLDVSLTISPILNKEGKIIGASKIVRDISERKRTEEELLRSNEFHSIIAAISTDWAYSARVESDGNIITDAVTEGFTKQLGYTLEELIENGGWESIVHSEDLPKANEEMQKLMSGEIITGRLRHISKYGHIIVSEYQTSPIVDKTGKVVRIYGANRDITSQILSEQLIRESESRLRNIIESATEYAIFTLTLNGTINSWSPGAEKIFGYTEMEVVGNKVDILFTHANRERNVPSREREMALTKGRATDDRFHLRKDGTRFFASGVMMPIVRNGVAEGFVKIARDMTAQISAEKAIREKEMLQKLFIAQENERQRIARDLHDELGQQLTALRLQLANALRICKDEKIRTEINNIQSIAKQIDNGVDFLAWELRPAVLDDLGLTAAFEKFIKEVANYSGVKIELLPTSLKGIRFPPEIETNLYRILQEALNNINKHSKAKNAEILLERRGDILLLIISDNGIGFNPKTIKTENKGIGLLGMKERATLIGGKIEIESTPGQGATIYVKVPGLFN